MAKDKFDRKKDHVNTGDDGDTPHDLGTPDPAPPTSDPAPFARIQGEFQGVENEPENPGDMASDAPDARGDHRQWVTVNSVSGGIHKPGSSSSSDNEYKYVSVRRFMMIGVGVIIILGIIGLLLFGLPGRQGDSSAGGSSAPEPTPKPTERPITLTGVDVWEHATVGCINDLSAVVPPVCVHNNGDQPLVLGDVQIEPGEEWCQERESNDGAWLSVSHSGISFALESSSSSHILPEDVLTIDLPDSQTAEEVTIVFMEVTWAVDNASQGIPNILILPIETPPGGTFDPYKSFNFKVNWGNTPSNTLDVDPIIDPDTGQVIGPIIVVFGNPEELKASINGNSPDPAVIDFVETSHGGQNADKPILALLLVVPAEQVLPDTLPPRCESVSLPPPDVTDEPTEEPPDSSVPVSTEEPTEEAVDLPPAVCGDLVCDPNTENTDLCPTDCQCVDDGVCSAGEGVSCQDCGSSAGFCGATCADSSQCAAGLACAGGVCWDALTCGSAPGGNSGGSGGGGSCGYGECGCQPDYKKDYDPDSGCTTVYDSCGNSKEFCD